MQSELEEYVKNHRLTHNVSFVGFVSEKDKPKYLASADIAVFPSTGGESFGIVLIEAMAAARGIVLGGNNVGYKSVLGKRPKQLFNPTNPKQFSKLLRHYIRQPKARQAARLWQQEEVAQYDVKVVGAKLLKIYVDALQTKHSVR